MRRVRRTAAAAAAPSVALSARPRRWPWRPWPRNGCWSLPAPACAGTSRSRAGRSSGDGGTLRKVRGSGGGSGFSLSRSGGSESGGAWGAASPAGSTRTRWQYSSAGNASENYSLADGDEMKWSLVSGFLMKKNVFKKRNKLWSERSCQLEVNV